MSNGRRQYMIQNITLEQMLQVREQRAYYQQMLIDKYNKPLVCFTMNIAGPIKNSPIIKRGFNIGLSDLVLQLNRIKAEIIFQDVWDSSTGNEAFLVIDYNGNKLKSLVCDLEDNTPLGRLYDMDVLLPTKPIHKLDRQSIGKSERLCLICHRPAKECSSRRIHSVSDLQKKTQEILIEELHNRHAVTIAELATRSLLYEVAVTPKPGLVDRANSGSHKDMNFYSFLNSSAALWPYFKECAQLGMEYVNSVDLKPLFTRLRKLGMKAEASMLRATENVNTHKGAIFTIGILCAAIGATYPTERMNSNAILKRCSSMTQGLVESDYANVTPANAYTAGQKFYVEYSVTGVRGEMEAGLPAVRDYGLPTLKELLADGKSEDQAGAAVLLTLMAHTTDTNLISRSNRQTQLECAMEAKNIIDNNSCPDTETINEMDIDFINQNLSPGGSADLLAACWLLYFVANEPLLH